MENDNLTQKVLESLSLTMQETSMSKELEALNGQIQTLSSEREKLETAKRLYLNAQSGATKAAQQAKEWATLAEKRIKEANLLAEKVVAATKEADAFAAMARRPIDFETPINETIKALNETDSTKKKLTTNLREVRIKQDELKKEGIDINLGGTKKVSGIAI